MFKKVYSLFIYLVLLFVLIACASTEQTGVAYGITYKDYVGVATVRVKNEEVVAANFEEYFLPNTWAEVKKTDISVPDDVILSSDSWYGKYLVIGNLNFTGILREEPLIIDGFTYTNQSIKYSSEGIDDLFVWIKSSQENMKWYVEALDAGNVYVAKADFSKHNYETAGLVNNNGVLAFTKSTTDYWSGWAGNMDEIAKAIKGSKMGVLAANITQKDGKWVIDGIESGATNVAFKEYYAIAQLAYDIAITK